ARSVALYAVDAEGGAAGGDGELAQLVIGEDLLDVARRDRLDETLLARLRLGQGAVELGAARIAEQARRGAADQRPGRVGDGIAERPDDGGVEGEQPPARHRVVEFADPVPFVTGRLDAGDLVNVLFAHDQSSLNGIF